MFTAPKDDTVRNLKNNFREAGEAALETKDELRTVANNAGRKVKDFIHTASDEITHAKDTVTTQIRTNPVQSSAIALGIGFLLGALFRR